MSPDASKDSTLHHDILIVGGGLAGLTLALALGRAGVSVGLVERHSLAATALPGFDGRTSALTEASKNLFQALDMWDKIAPHAGPIQDIRIVDGHSPLFLHYAATDVDSEALGYIVENRHLRHELLVSIAQQTIVTLYDDVNYNQVAYNHSGVEITLEDQRMLTGELLVACDGKHSALREQMAISTRRAEYQQSALVCTIQHEKPHHQLAVEHFLPAGPFAVLPMADPHQSSIVWTESAQDAALYVQLAPDDLATQLAQRMDNFLGDIKVIGDVATYPLSLVVALNYTATRFALVGDAAHAIHPIAGQGFNLGLRDVAVLAEMIVTRKRLGLDPGSHTALSGYTRVAAPDHVLMVAATDGLNRLFSNDIAPIKQLRRLGLKAVHHAAPLKRRFIRHAMGRRKTLPKLLSGKAL